GIMRDLARVRRRGQPRWHLGGDGAPAGPRELPAHVIDRAGRAAAADLALADPDQGILGALADLRLLDRHEVLRGACLGAVEPRGPHRGASIAVFGHEQRLADPRSALAVRVDHDGEPDLHPRALALPDGSVGALRHPLPHTSFAGCGTECNRWKTHFVLP